jgi:HAD superfamily hydrolase (TIGR01509 family)
MIDAIFFDFNGVIIDDERLQMAAYQEVFRPHGIELTAESYFSALGMDDKTFVRTTFKRAGKQLAETTFQSILDDKAAKHRKLIEDELPLFPGVVTFLKAASRNYELGLVSMASTFEVGYVLERARLGPLFSVVVTSDDVSACKPAPECYECALRKLNHQRRERRLLPLLAQECLVIEDSPPGIKSGWAAGMRTLAITNTVSESELRAAGAEVVTHSLADWTVDAVYHLFS